MAANTGGPSSWWDDPPPGGGQLRRIDGSYVGPTLPEYMDPEKNHGAIRILRIQGKDKAALPDKPFVIRKSIQQQAQGKIEGAFPEADGKMYALKVRNTRQYDRLLQMKALIDGTPVEVIKHPNLNTTRCVVSCRKVIGDTEAELVEELKDQGVREVRRIKRRTEGGQENTPTLIITCEGTTFPEAIDFGYLRCRTRPYYPSPMQCFNCWAFGHTRLRCRASKPICGKCSEDHPILEDRACNKGTFCKRCESDQHAISNRSCPAYKRENEIQRIKVDSGSTYLEAKKLFDRRNGSRSYASVATASVDSTLAQMNQRMTELETQLKEKDLVIAQLQAAAEQSRRKDRTIAELEAALRSKGITTVSIPQVTTSIPSMADFQKIIEETVMRTVKSVVLTNIETQRRIQTLVPEQQSSSLPSTSAADPAPLSHIGSQTSKKNKKKNKEKCSPATDVPSIENSVTPSVSNENAAITGVANNEASSSLFEKTTQPDALNSTSGQTISDLSANSVPSDDCPNPPRNTTPQIDEAAKTDTPIPTDSSKSYDPENSPKGPIKRPFLNLSPPMGPSRLTPAPKVQRQKLNDDE